MRTPQRIAWALMASAVLTITVGGLVGCATCFSKKLPWEDPYYAKDISATQADSRAEERAKGGWTEFIRHHEDRKRWVTDKNVDILMIGDSIVFGWSREGHEVWDEHYGSRNAVNIGSSGDTNLAYAVAYSGRRTGWDERPES